MNNPSHKIYRCMTVLSTRYYMILHAPTILHRKTFFAPFCHLRKKILSGTKLSHSSMIHPHSPQTSLSTSNYDSNINLSQTFSLFPYLGLVLALQLWLRSGHALVYKRYLSLHATTQVTDYFIHKLLASNTMLAKKGGSFVQSILFVSIPH